VAVAGGLKLDSVTQALTAGAEIVVVGGGILNQPDPGAAAAAIMKRLSEKTR
jgi:3-keto-L-gulonate-6-phosphate decarboxylase